jgi:membrane fusion protein (multidrug efflux system)
MSTAFPNTMRSLETARPATGWRRLVLGVLVLIVWALWMTFCRVSVYASTTSARLETVTMPHRLAAPDSGRVAAVHLGLGRAVEAGEILLELDTQVEQKHLDEATAKLATLGPEIEALSRRIELEQAARGYQLQVDSANVRRADVDSKSLDLGSANREAIRELYGRLRDAELASRIDQLNSQKDADEYRLKASGAEVDLQRMRATSSFNDARAMANISELARERVQMEADQALARAAAETAAAQIERRKVRAQIRGRLGNITPVQIGDVVRVGDAIATVIPEDGVRIVAEFAPAEAAGRLAPGQTARMRLNGFAWTQYGTLAARVDEVASEPGDGSMRVELRLDDAASSAVPIQHGLPGSVDVEVERVSPWTLLLRGVGTAVSGGGTTPARAPTPSPSTSAGI